jgi:hypothetical protein
MAVTSSGQIAMSDIVNEFGGNAPHSISEYYRGGGEVPTSITLVSNYLSLDSTFVFYAYNLSGGYWVWQWWFGGTLVGGTSASQFSSGNRTYYRNGAISNRYFYSPDGTYYYGTPYAMTVIETANLNVPSSGQISFSQFYGARNT